MAPFGKGDLTIEWDAASHDAVIGQIQALIERGVAFHRIETKGTGKIRRKMVGQPIGSTTEISDRRVLITDAEIEKLIPDLRDLCENFGIEPPPPPDKPRRRARKGQRERS
jgi:hypothetical protein